MLLVESEEDVDLLFVEKVELNQFVINERGKWTRKV